MSQLAVHHVNNNNMYKLFRICAPAPPFLELFAAQIHNPNTRRAYSRAVSDFLTWYVDDAEVPSIAAVQPLHVAAWIEAQTRKLSAPTVKQHLAAIRHLFDQSVIS